MDDENKTFSFTYSAKQQDEVRRIQQKYLPREQDKLERLRELDKQAERKATMLAVTVGVIGTLMLGIGMTCATVLTEYFIPGIFIGVLGILILSLALPLYRRLVKKQREKVAPQVLALTKELMHESNQ